MVGEELTALFQRRTSELRRGRQKLETLSISPSEARRQGIAVNADGHLRTAFALLSYPDVTPADLKRLWPELAALPEATFEQLAIDAQYAVYVDRQKADVEAVRRDELREIPAWMDYERLPGLSNEVRQKLTRVSPSTIAQAQAIEGVTPAAVTLLLSVIRRGYLAQAS